MHPKKLESRIMLAVTRASQDFGLLAANDRILVAMSGGKDSYGMLWALKKMRALLPFRIDLVAYHLDQGQPGHDVRPIEQHMASSGLPYEVEYQDTYTRVVEKTEPGKVYCSLCSRFRRAILYKAAIRHGCNKVALGHHRDDLIETLLLNVFYSGQIKAMPARLRSDRGIHEVIRPLCYAAEEDMQALSDLHAYPVVPCQLCGSLATQRKAIKQLLRQLGSQSEHIKGNILASLSNVLPSHLLDRRLNPLHLGEAASVEAELGLVGEVAPVGGGPLTSPQATGCGSRATPTAAPAGLAVL